MDRSPTLVPADAVGADLAAELTELERFRAVDVEARLARATEIEAAAVAAGDERSRQRARLVVADMLPRRGDIGGGARLTAEVRAWAEANGDRAVQSRAELVLSSLFAGIGDGPSSLDHAVRALELLPEGSSDRDRGACLMAVANALAFDGSVDDARRRYREAEQAYAAAGEHVRALDVLNNLLVLEYETGDPLATVHAAELADRARAAGEMNADFADSIARARLAVGDLDGADAVVHEGLALLAAQGDAQAVTPAELQLTRAEVALALGRLADAVDALDRCEEVCAARQLHGLQVAALGVRAEVHAAAGDHRLAYEVHRRFHDESVGLRRRQQAEAAHLRHALLATAEARREAHRFWVQARTDPLTGLRNRRYVDETLPRRLADPALADTPVAAIVDVDHFKRINDRFTHAVGDRVLVALAELLEHAVADDASGFAARLGGEEFLVVLGDGGPDACERLRRAVAEHDWEAVAPGLRVSVSVGVARQRPGDTQHSLLARADACLYRAKQTGRDRVVTDDEPGADPARTSR